MNNTQEHHPKISAFDADAEFAIDFVQPNPKIVICESTINRSFYVHFMLPKALQNIQNWIHNFFINFTKTDVFVHGRVPKLHSLIQILQLLANNNTCNIVHICIKV